MKNQKYIKIAQDHIEQLTILLFKPEAGMKVEKIEKLIAFYMNEIIRLGAEA